MADYTIRFLLEGDDRASGPLQSAGGALGNVASIAGGILAADIFRKIGQGAVDMARDFMASASEAEDAGVRLAAVFEATGRTGQFNAQSAFEQAGALQEVTRFSDEAVMAGQAILATFDKVGEEAFGRATALGLDMASVFGMDASSAMRALGRALQDPAEGLAALSRLGIRFTEEQQKQIEAMVAAGDAAAAQAFIMDELEGRVGGVAEAMGSTGAGQIERFKNQLDELKETLGAPILGFLAEQASGLIPLVQQLGGVLSDMLSGEFDWSKIIPPSILEAIGRISGAFADLGSAFASTGDDAEAGLGSFVDWLTGPFAGMVAQTIDNVVETLHMFAGWWRENGPEVIQIVTFLAKVIGATLGGAIELVSGLFRTLMAVFNDSPAQVVDAIGATLTGFFNAAAGIVGVNWESFKATWQANWDMLVTIIGAVMERLKTAISTRISGFFQAGRDIVEGLKRGLENAWGSVVTWFEDQVGKLLDGVKDWLGISSPSSVFAEIGQNMAAGMAQGFGLGTMAPAMAQAGAAGAVSTTYDQRRSVSVAEMNVYGAYSPGAVREELASFMEGR